MLSMLYLSTAQAAEYKVETLDNGLTIITANVSYTPLLMLKVQFDAGAKTETKETDGLTHLLEHLFMKGNGLAPNEVAYRKRERQLGIISNATTGRDYVDYHFIFPAMFLEETSELAAASVFSLALDPQEIKDEIRVVNDEFNRYALKPSFASNNVLNHLVYGNKYYGVTPLGMTKKYILEANRDKLKKLTDSIMAPANTRIYLVGNVDHDNAVKVIDKYFGHWKAPEGWQKPPYVEFPDFPSTSKRMNFSHPRQTEAVANIRFDAFKVSENPEDSYVADVFSTLLSHKGTPFYQKYIKTGEIYDGYMYYLTTSVAPYINMGIAAQANKIDQAIENMFNEAKEWAKPDYFTQTQLDEVKLKLSVEFKVKADDFLDLEGHLSYFTAAADINYYAGYLKGMQSVTLEDLSRYIQKYVIDKPHTMVVLYNAEKAKELKVNLDGDAYFAKHLKAHLEYSLDNK